MKWTLVSDFSFSRTAEGTEAPSIGRFPRHVSPEEAMTPSITLSYLSPRAACRLCLVGLGTCVLAAVLRIAGLSFDTWPTATLLWCGLLTTGLGLGLFSESG